MLIVNVIATVSARMTGGGVQVRSVNTYTITAGLSPYTFMLGNSDIWWVEYVEPTEEARSIQVEWSPTNDMLLIIAQNDIQIVNADSGDVLFSEAIIVQDVQWSPDGRFIITQDTRRRISSLGQ